ncbi:MAG: PQQ-binding-like beta-propeller repeat protein [Verrucomicrobiota bacterium]
MKKRAFCLITILSTLIPGQADDWPHFLGPHHDLRWREEGIRTSLDDSPLKVRWRTPVGGGYSAPAVVGNRVFLMDRTTSFPDTETEGNPNFFRAEIDGNERVLCLQEADGKVLWTHEYPCSYTTATPYAIGPRCTPTVDGDRLYTLGAEGDFYCLDVDDGRVLWEKHFKKDYGAETNNWGWSSHPLIYRDSVITMVGGEGSAVVSFDKETGAENWRALSTRDIGYCPPTLVMIGDELHLIVWHSESLAGINPDTGQVRWKVDHKATYGMAIHPPRYDPEMSAFLISSFNGKTSFIQVKKAGLIYDTRFLWDCEPKEGLGSVMNTPILLGRHAYACGQRGEFRCIRLEDGQIVWKSTQPSAPGGQKKRHYWSHLFSFSHPPSGNHFLANDQGELLIADLRPTGYRELSRTSVIKPTHRVGSTLVNWSQPAFARQSIYWRNDEELLCVSLKAEKTTKAIQGTDNQNPFTREVEEALKKSLNHQTTLSRFGGYVWQTSTDLRQREGEAKTGPDTIWVQSPGTPAIGARFLRTYHITGEKVWLNAARAAARALLEGQLASGGWDYRIEFGSKERTGYAYRRGGSPDGKNVTTLDDDTTQGVLRFLMDLDEATGFADADLKNAIQTALDSLTRVQRPNGGWPQRFTRFPDPRDYPDLKASFPDRWGRQWDEKRTYKDDYTLNDNTQIDTIKTFLHAWRLYKKEPYLRTAIKGGDFLLRARMPEPQPAWAQQYDRKMHPSWARKFEPPAISGGESQNILLALMHLYRQTGEKRFLEAVPTTLEYLRRSTLPNGRLARFYELKTNRPLFFTRDYQLTYESNDLPNHYSFIVSSKLDKIADVYEDTVKYGARLFPGEGKPPKPSEKLNKAAKRALALQSPDGSWIEKGRLRFHKNQPSDGLIIRSQSWLDHTGTLLDYLEARSTSPEEPKNQNFR